MSFTLFIDTPCPKCHEPVKVRAIELHLARAVHRQQFLKSPRCMEGPRRNSDATSWDSARVLKKDRNSWHEFS
jgi:hypothetical protein